MERRARDGQNITHSGNEVKSPERLVKLHIVRAVNKRA